MWNKIKNLCLIINNNDWILPAFYKAKYIPSILLPTPIPERKKGIS
jgi:hypothetical protein